MTKETLGAKVARLDDPLKDFEFHVPAICGCDQENIDAFAERMHPTINAALRIEPLCPGGVMAGILMHVASLAIEAECEEGVAALFRAYADQIEHAAALKAGSIQ